MKRINLNKKIDITQAGWYTWYKIERFGYGGVLPVRTRRDAMRVGLSQWLSMRAHNHGKELECGCTHYLFRIRLYKMRCPEHGLKIG